MSSTPERPEGPTAHDLVDTALLLILFLYVLYHLPA